jgi:hypothetical protein
LRQHADDQRLGLVLIGRAGPVDGIQVAFIADGGLERIASGDDRLDSVDSRRASSKLALVMVTKSASVTKQPHARIGPALPGRVLGDDGQSLEQIDQQILQMGGLGMLAADTLGGAPKTLGRFFTLETEHTHDRLALIQTDRTFDETSMAPRGGERLDVSQMARAYRMDGPPGWLFQAGTSQAGGTE